MKPFLILLSLIALAGCSQHRHARRTHATKTVAVHHLPDGRYAYHDDSGNLWLYMYLNSSTHTETFYRSTSTTSLPRGGGWVSSSSSKVSPAERESAEKEIDEPETEVVEQSVEVDAAGGPMTLDEAIENASFDGTEAHADGMSDDAGSSDSSSSSSDSSSSADSGSSGGDGGSSGD